MPEKKDEKILKPKRISELIEGDKLFDSSGYALVKVTKVGKEELLELPIKSTGVDELQEKLSSKAPRPPVRRELIKKGSKEGRELGLSHDKFEQVFDNTDEDYIDKLEKHNQDFTWQTVIFALDMKWTKKDGSEAKTFEEKKEILKSNDLTIDHANQIFEDVQRLTKLQEGREDFLSET